MAKKPKPKHGHIEKKDAKKLFEQEFGGKKRDDSGRFTKKDQK